MQNRFLEFYDESVAYISAKSEIILILVSKGFFQGTVAQQFSASSGKSAPRATLIFPAKTLFFSYSQKIFEKSM